VLAVFRQPVFDFVLLMYGAYCSASSEAGRLVFTLFFLLLTSYFLLLTFYPLRHSTKYCGFLARQPNFYHCNLFIYIVVIIEIAYFGILEKLLDNHRFLVNIILIN